ncbi:hypothetical protein BH11BAC4_BH11BAC4_08710 [soil metagenome]
MKTSAKTLRNFILDFDLGCVDQSVCFTAALAFTAEGVFKTLDTEIHVVTLQVTGLSILYLLSIAIAEQNIPDTLPFTEELFSYTKGQCLTIKGNSDHYGPYTMEIFPIEKICYPQTLEEIKHKTLN